MTWKRIQTLLIVLAAGLVFAMLCCNLAYADAEDPSQPGALVREYIRFTDNLTLTLFAALILILTAFLPALHRQLYLQGRLCVVVIILLLFYQGFTAYWFFKLHDAYVFTVAAVFPAIAAVLLGMAHHYIRRDFARAMVDQAFAKRFPRRKAASDENNKQ